MEHWQVHVSHMGICEKRAGELVHIAVEVNAMNTRHNHVKCSCKSFFAYIAEDLQKPRTRIGILSCLGHVSRVDFASSAKPYYRHCCLGQPPSLCVKKMIEGDGHRGLIQVYDGAYYSLHIT